MKFEAVVRTELGKGASRRLRHAGKFLQLYTAVKKQQ